MKKLFLPALLLLGFGSVAFYVKDAPAAQYMTVIGSTRPGGIGSSIAEIISIEASGMPKIKEVDTRSGRGNSTNALLLHRAEVLYLNELSAQGWHVVNAVQSGSMQSGQLETTYFLERRLPN